MILVPDFTLKKKRVVFYRRSFVGKSGGIGIPLYILSNGVQTSSFSLFFDVMVCVSNARTISQ